ncbi:MAG: hypothetical protein DMG24_21205 [Acidobacteria bacterium]|nr:MAG: hypothetical protein DMG24_21205 [Acidobacteriota bacterium]
MCGELPAASGYSPLLLSGWPGWKSSKLARLYEKYGVSNGQGDLGDSGDFAADTGSNKRSQMPLNL